MSCSGMLRLTVLVAAVALLGAPALRADHHETTQDEGGDAQAAAMQAYMQAATPGEQHAALAAQTGTYKMTVKSFYGGAEPEVSEGTAERTMTMDGRVLEEKVSSEMGGGMSFHGLGRTGYDNVTGKYWSTWTDTMSTGITVMHGSWDEGGKSGTFTGETPDPMSGGTKWMRIQMSENEDGTEVSEFYEKGPDGEEMKTMEIVYEPAD